MLDVADQVCTQYRQKFEEVSLSRRTVTHRNEAIDKDLTSQLEGHVPLFQLFSLTLHENTDIDSSCSSLYEALKLLNNYFLWNQ